MSREKLLTARMQIEQILRDNDLIAHVVMAAPDGLCEAMLHFDAPWSKVRLEPCPEGHAIRVRSNRAEYGGDLDAQKRDLESTLGAISSMAELTGRAAVAMIDLLSDLHEKIDFDQTPLVREHRQ